MTKVLMLVADGMGDWPLDELQGQTPLQAAFTPHMDSLAGKSRLGLCQTIPEGMPPGSDIANMALLGYDPAVYHTGRGPIEAAAQGLETGTEDLIWRLNLVTLSRAGAGGKMLDYAGGHITTEQALPLMERLQQEAGSQDLEFLVGVQYRHLLVQRLGATSACARVNIRPPHDILDQEIDQDLQEFAGCPALESVFYRSARILENRVSGTKVNAVWPWGQGRSMSLPSFQKKFNMSGMVITAVDLIRGLGRAAGMEVAEVPGATGLLETNYQGKAEAAVSFLKSGDFVFVHLEGPDECGHMGSIADKTEAIARFDRHIVGPLLKQLQGSDFIMIICCDHLTPIRIRTHARDPVPFLIYSSTHPRPGSEVFSEESARASGLLLDRGEDLLAAALES
ncbi:MAG: cofactor-independent phosphoglycerate mutase [Desulfonatronovibrionaceae bacterium]